MLTNYFEVRTVVVAERCWAGVKLRSVDGKASSLLLFIMAVLKMKGEGGAQSNLLPFLTLCLTLMQE
jgi:hypothetical protein